MKLGDCFLMPVPPKFEREHLWFVMSDPAKCGGTFIIANITTDLLRAGKECVLTAGDHPWITGECFVTFADALEITPDRAQYLDLLIGTKVIMHQPLKPAILARIVEAAKVSRAFPVSFKKYL